MSDATSDQFRHALPTAADPETLRPSPSDGRRTSLICLTKPEFAAAVLLGSADARAVAVFDQPQLRRSAAIVSMLPADRAARLPDQMSADRVADIVGELPVSVRNDLLALVSSETRAALERLLRYPEHCAGTIMTNRVRLRSVGLDG